jgi:hypothetical protein
MADSDFQAEPPRPPRRRVKRPRRADYDDYDDVENDYDDPVQTLIPYKNALALAAYYCGVFSWIPIAGVILGPGAIVLGFLGYRYGRKHPTAKGTGHAVAGIVFGLFGSMETVGLIILLWMAASGSRLFMK